MVMQQVSVGLIEVRNKAKGPTVFADKNTNSEHVWAGAGDESGEDVQMCSGVLLDSPAFRKALDNGVLELLEDPQVASTAANARQESYEARSNVHAANVDGALLIPDEHDIIALPCVGPGTRPGAPCGVFANFPAIEREHRPPLCARHTGLHDKYISTGKDEHGPIWTIKPKDGE